MIIIYSSYDAFVEVAGKIVDISDVLRRKKNLPFQRAANFFPDQEEGVEETDSSMFEGDCVFDES